jgi:hypothetical protein
MPALGIMLSGAGGYLLVYNITDLGGNIMIGALAGFMIGMGWAIASAVWPLKMKQMASSVGSEVHGFIVAPKYQHVNPSRKMPPEVFPPLTRFDLQLNTC